jgi:hypothetical protein
MAPGPARETDGSTCPRERDGASRVAVRNRFREALEDREWWDQHSFSHFYQTVVAEELRELARRHQKQVVELAFELRHGDMDDQLLQQSIDRLTASYEAQIVQALRAVGEASNRKASVCL